MVRNCANSSCATVRRPNQGKLFRLDIDLGSVTGADERVTEYVWLCASCAQVMYPKIKVHGDTVTLCLTMNDSLPVRAAGTSALQWAN